MSWIRFGDELVNDRAILDLGDDEYSAGWTYVRAVSYAARHLTDGELPVGFLRREDPAGVAALARVGLLELRADGSGSLPRFLEVRDAGGRVIAGHHPSKADVEARRQKRADAGQVGGVASGEARRKASGQATREASPKQSASQLAEQDGKQDANPVSRTPVTRDPDDPNPAPTARETSEAAEGVFAAIEARGVKVRRQNGHAETIRELVDRFGQAHVLETLDGLRTVDGFRQAATSLDDALRPPVRATSPRNGSHPLTDYDSTTVRDSDDDESDSRVAAFFEDTTNG